MGERGKFGSLTLIAGNISLESSVNFNIFFGSVLLSTDFCVSVLKVESFWVNLLVKFD